MKTVIKSYITNDATRSIRWASIPPYWHRQPIRNGEKIHEETAAYPTAMNTKRKNARRWYRFTVELTP